MHVISTIDRARARQFMAISATFSASRRVRQVRRCCCAKGAGEVYLVEYFSSAGVTPAEDASRNAGVGHELPANPRYRALRPCLRALLSSAPARTPLDRSPPGGADQRIARQKKGILDSENDQNVGQNW